MSSILIKTIQQHSHPLQLKDRMAGFHAGATNVIAQGTAKKMNPRSHIIAGVWK